MEMANNYQLVDLRGKRIVITGASSGIGRATAILLGEMGAQLALIARREDKLLEVSREANCFESIEHQYYILDLSVNDEIEAVASRICKEMGPVDGVVYAAGISDNRPLRMFEVVDFDRILHTNLSGFIEMTKCFTKRHRFQEGMRIVAVSSVSAYHGNPAHFIYSASKAGMNGVVRCMAKELARKGICVNAVAPGMVQTAMHDDFMNINIADNSEGIGIRFQRQYLGVAQPEDIAAAIAFLLSPAARMITGVCLPVDGGYTSG